MPLQERGVKTAIFTVLFAVFVLFPVSSFQEEDSAAGVDRLVKMLKEEQESIRARELILSQRERRLQVIKAEIEEKVKELMKLKEELDAYFKRVEELNSQRLIGLAKLCEAAPPDKAGKILSGLDPEFAAEILLKMNRRKAGAVLGAMDPKSATKVAETIEKMIK